MNQKKEEELFCEAYTVYMLQGDSRKTAHIKALKYIKDKKKEEKTKRGKGRKIKKDSGR